MVILSDNLEPPNLEKFLRDRMADQFCRSMPTILNRSVLDELYKCLRDLDYTQVDERMAMMLNAILQLVAQGPLHDKIYVGASRGSRRKQKAVSEHGEGFNRTRPSKEHWS